MKVPVRWQHSVSSYFWHYDANECHMRGPLIDRGWGRPTQNQRWCLVVAQLVDNLLATTTTTTFRFWHEQGPLVCLARPVTLRGCRNSESTVVCCS